MSGDKVKHAPLTGGQLERLRALVKRDGDGILLADFPGVGGTAMSRALAGQPVRAATRELIRLGLERLAAAKVKATTIRYINNTGKNLDMFHGAICKACDAGGVLPEELADLFTLTRPAGIWRVDWVSVPGDETRKPVCPRCLDVTPGTPGGTPEEPHPGPFTEGLCAACDKAVKP